jgi:hypothetical protein
MVPGETDTAPRIVRPPTETLLATGNATLRRVTASGSANFPTIGSGNVILSPVTASGAVTIPPRASGNVILSPVTASGAASASTPVSGDSRFVTVAEVNAGLGMYGLYNTTGSIDNRLVPATGGNIYIQRAYSRTDSGITWRLRWNNSQGGADPGASVSESTWSFINVTHSTGTMQLDFRRTSNGGDIFLDSFGSSGFAYMNAPDVWDGADVGLVYEVEFIP